MPKTINILGLYKNASTGLPEPSTPPRINPPAIAIG